MIAIITLCFFAVPFILGCFSIGRIPGIACIGVTGGFALGIRIVILRPNLLVQGNNGLGVNWAIISLFGLAGLAPIIFPQSQRWGLVSVSVSRMITNLMRNIAIWMLFDWLIPAGSWPRSNSKESGRHE
jgi:hypothetical protein